MPGHAISFPAGDYSYMPGVFQYSCGVAALPGARIERVRFATPVPLAEGFRRIDAFLRQVGRPVTALCACELHSPAPFTEHGFEAFNRVMSARWSAGASTMTASTRWHGPTLARY